MGAVTEAAELMDALKKSKIYGRPLDRVNLVEEMGDLTWYLAILADELGVSFEEIWEKNINKLRQRYPEKYSDQQAEERDVAKERKILEGES
jgi:NTP pyrophosphatase (non-canonical NTP hydrolase)